MKEALAEIFSEYGNVVDLVAKKNLKAKGQAFIVFDDVEAAERAIKEVQGFELFDKPMILDYAKTKSDATVEREGSAEDLESHKRRRLAEKGMHGSGRLQSLDNGLICISNSRAETSSRSGRGSEETQAIRRSCGTRSCATRQGSPRCRTQVIESCRWCSRAGGVSATQQDSVCPESARQLRCGQSYIHLRQVSRFSGGAVGARKDGDSFRGVRRGERCY